MSQASAEPFVLYKDLALERIGHVAIVEIRRAPHNYFDQELIAGLVAVFEHLDGDVSCRAIVLAADGKSFCAGADFSGSGTLTKSTPRQIYMHAVRLFRTHKPIVAAVHGGAIGGGLGLALVADFRVTSSDARFSANFNRLGFHQGFGLSVTLPRLVGPQMAALLLFTGRRIDGAEAQRIGLADVLVAPGEVRQAAIALAGEIAASAPLAVMSSRATLREGLAGQIDFAVEHEATEQEWQIKTADFAEGVAAMSERRVPDFTGR